MKTVFDLRLVIPTNTRAAVFLPTLGLDQLELTESGIALWKNGAYVPGIAGVTDGRSEDQVLVFVAGGGRYQFPPAGTAARVIRTPSGETGRDVSARRLTNKRRPHGSCAAVTNKRRPHGRGAPPQAGGRGDDRYPDFTA